MTPKFLIPNNQLAKGIIMLQTSHQTQAPESRQFAELVELCRARGKNRKQLAAALGLSESSIQKKQAGHTVVRQCEIDGLRAIVEGR